MLLSSSYTFNSTFILIKYWEAESLSNLHAHIRGVYNKLSYILKSILLLKWTKISIELNLIAQCTKEWPWLFITKMEASFFSRNLNISILLFLTA